MKFAVRWDKDNKFVFKSVYPKNGEAGRKYFAVKLNHKTIVSKESLFSPSPGEDDPAYIFLDFCGWVKSILGENHPLTEDLYLLNNDFECDDTDEELLRMYIIMLINRMVKVL